MKYRFAMERERLQREIMHLPIQSVGRRSKYKSALFLKRFSDFCILRFLAKFTQPHRFSLFNVVREACRPKFLVSTLLPTRSGEWQTNTEIAHLHFKAAIVHFLPDLQFGGAPDDVNTLLVRVVVDCVAAAWAATRVRVREGWRLRWGWFAPSLVRSLTRVVCSGNNGERANRLHSRPPPIGADSVTNTIRPGDDGKAGRGP